MIINILINVIVLIIGAIFSWLPIVSTLPTIAGYDIDGALVSGMGYFNTFTTTFWPVAYMFQAFLFLMAYYLLKIGIIFFLGHRAPGKK